jgi:hypothetical protein
MNFIFDICDFNIENIHLFEKKKNIVIDGIFTKIVYSDELLTMNGIYLKFPLDLQTNTNTNTYTHRNIHFYPYSSVNLSYIKQFSQIEEMIINYYKFFYNIRKKNNMVLTSQLYSGFFKLYRDSNEIKPNTRYVLKISGIWENKTDIGITYKIMEMCDNR